MALCVNEIIITKCGIKYLRVSEETPLLDLTILCGLRNNSENIKKIVDTMNQFLVGIIDSNIRIEGSFEDLEELGTREALFLDINLFILLTDWPYCDIIGCFKRQRKAHRGMKSHVHLSP